VLHIYIYIYMYDISSLRVKAIPTDPHLALSALNSYFSLQNILVSVRNSLTTIVRAVFLLFSKD